MMERMLNVVGKSVAVLAVVISKMGQSQPERNTDVHRWIIAEAYPLSKWICQK